MLSSITLDDTRAFPRCLLVNPFADLFVLRESRLFDVGFAQLVGLAGNHVGRRDQASDRRAAFRADLQRLFADSLQDGKTPATMVAARFFGIDVFVKRHGKRNRRRLAIMWA